MAQKLTREELVKLSVQHFKKLEAENSLLACEDGQFFLNNATSQGQLDTHCKELELKSFVIERAEALGNEKANVKAVVTDIKKMKKDDLIALATSKGIAVPEDATVKQLIELIEPQEPAAQDTGEGEAKAE